MKTILLSAFIIQSFAAFAETIKCHNSELDIKLSVTTIATEFPNADIIVNFRMGDINKKFSLIGFYKSGYNFDSNKAYSGYTIPFNGNPLATKELISYSFFENEIIGNGYIDMRELELEHTKLKCSRADLNQ